MNHILDWPLLAARFATLVLGIGLFGQAAFDLYAPASVRRTAPAAVRLAAPLAAALAALAWSGALCREITAAGGLPAASDLLRMWRDTGFGRGLGGAVLAALALAGLALSPKRPLRLKAWLAGGLLVCLAFVGHPAASPAGASGAVRVGVFAAHLLGAGVWLGGLLPLARALPRAGDDTALLLREFGRIALATVALLVTTGMVIAAAVFALAHGPPGMTYVKTLIVKLSLVAALLGVASLNRWWLTPLAARDPVAARRALAWTIAAEQALALAVIAAVTLLGQTDPAS